MYEFTPLEIAAVHRMKHPKHGEDEDMPPSCMSKLVCVRSLGERVVGFHFIGPNAGEITQVTALLNSAEMYCTVLCCAVLCCAVLCCAVLCCTVLCRAVLCCAVPSCAVLYCAVLSYDRFAVRRTTLDSIFFYMINTIYSYPK